MMTCTLSDSLSASVLDQQRIPRHQRALALHRPALALHEIKSIASASANFCRESASPELDAARLGAPSARCEYARLFGFSLELALLDLPLLERAGCAS